MGVEKPKTKSPAHADTDRPPRRILPVIIFSLFTGGSLWFAGNAVLADLQRLWGERRISTETLDWSADMNDWAALRSVETLRKALGA